MTESVMKCSIEHGEKDTLVVSLVVIPSIVPDGEEPTPTEVIFNAVIPRRYRLVADMIVSTLELGIRMGMLRPQSGT